MLTCACRLLAALNKKPILNQGLDGSLMTPMRKKDCYSGNWQDTAKKNVIYVYIYISMKFVNGHNTNIYKQYNELVHTVRKDSNSTFQIQI